MPTSNGYELSFLGRSTRREADATITIYPAGGSPSRNEDPVNPLVRTSYHVAPHRLSRNLISADFGPYGTVEVRFEPTGQATHGRCRSTRVGTFRGTIRFEGEGGYTAVETASVEGRVTRHESGVCIPGTPFRSSGAPDDLTTCDAAAGYGYLAFRAPDFFGPGVLHGAQVYERVGGVDVLRSASVFGRRQSLLYGSTRESARVDPPAPFLGTAVLRHGVLTGDLAVPLPGLPEPLRLTPARGTLDGEGSSDGPEPCDSVFFPPGVPLESEQRWFVH